MVRAKEEGSVVSKKTKRSDQIGSSSSAVQPRRKSARLAAIVSAASEQRKAAAAAAASSSLGLPYNEADEGGGDKKANAEPNVEDMKPLIIPILKRVKWSTSTRVVDHIIEKLGYTWYLVYIFIHVSAVEGILSAYVTPT